MMQLRILIATLLATEIRTASEQVALGQGDADARSVGLK
jgi:hypothetical protein